MLTKYVHRYAGTADTLTVHLDRSPARYGLDLAIAGYKGSVPTVVRLIEAGDIVHIKQFDVTVCLTHAPEGAARNSWSA